MGHWGRLLPRCGDAGVDCLHPRRQGNEVLAIRGEAGLRLRCFSFRLCLGSADWLCVRGCKAPRHALCDVDVACGFDPQRHRDHHLLHSARSAAAPVSWMFSTGKIWICFLPLLRDSDEAHLPQLRPRCGARLGELSGVRFKTTGRSYDSSYSVAAHERGGRGALWRGLHLHRLINRPVRAAGIRGRRAFCRHLKTRRRSFHFVRISVAAIPEHRHRTSRFQFLKRAVRSVFRLVCAFGLRNREQIIFHAHALIVCIGVPVSDDCIFEKYSL